MPNLHFGLDLLGIDGIVGSFSTISRKKGDMSYYGNGGHCGVNSINLSDEGLTFTLMINSLITNHNMTALLSINRCIN